MITVGAIGIDIEIDTLLPEDYAEALTYHKLECTNPDATVVEWEGVMSGSKMRYTTGASDLLQRGKYVIKAYVKIGGSFLNKGDPYILTVE